MDWLSSTELFLNFRQKLNNFNSIMRITQTSAGITTGTITSVPVDDFQSEVLKSGNKIWLEDIDTYQLHELTLTADYTEGDGAISVSSYVLSSDVAAGSVIYYKLSDLLIRFNV